MKRSIRPLVSVVALAAGLLASASAQAAPSASPAASGVQFDFGPLKTADANLAIVAYLGSPVPAPLPLDPRYSADGLSAALRQLCAKLGCTVESLEVDTTEYPYLVMGVVTGPRFREEMRNALNALPGYAYVSSSALRQNDRTFFALNMIPAKAYPPEKITAIQRRMTVRLQMLLAATVDAHR